MALLSVETYGSWDVKLVVDKEYCQGNCWDIAGSNLDSRVAQYLCRLHAGQSTHKSYSDLERN